MSFLVDCILFGLLCGPKVEPTNPLAHNGQRSPTTAPILIYGLLFSVNFHVL